MGNCDHVARAGRTCAIYIVFFSHDDDDNDVTMSSYVVDCDIRALCDKL